MDWISSQASERGRHVGRIATLILLATSITGVADAQVQSQDQPAIYGADTREEFYEHEDASFRQIARESVVALMSAYRLDAADPTSFHAPQMRTAMNLCLDEPYARQPAAAFCSGVLVAPDIVLTAGHCFPGGDTQCRLTRFVFDYLEEAEGVPAAVEAESIYACQSLLVQTEVTTLDGIQDWAFVQLDRPVEGDRRPAALRTSFQRTADGATLPQAVALGAKVWLAGFPMGVPLKIDAGGSVRATGSRSLATFSTTADAFVGNSGSGVWTLEGGEHRLAGILVSGESDLVNDPGGQRCQRSRFCGPGECVGENVVYLDRAIAELCSSVGGGAISHELCGDAGPRCGDGFCDAREREAGAHCAADCGPADARSVCGDGLCEADEWSSCTQDCRPTMPSNATCDAVNFGTFDGCHSCQVEDPDCRLSNAQTGGLGGLFNCHVGGAGSGLAWALAFIGTLLLRRRRRAAA